MDLKQWTQDIVVNILNGLAYLLLGLAFCTHYKHQILVQIHSF